MTNIKIVQVNLQHAVGAVAVLMKTLVEMSINIALLQEPWTGGDGRIRGMGCFKGKVFACKPSDGPRACVLITDPLNAEILPQFLSRDLVAVRMTLRGVKTVIASAYFSHSEESPPQELTRLVDYCKREGMQYLIGCDANSWNVAWGSTDTNERGSDLMEYLSAENLTVLNRGSKPTFVTANRQQVLDITLACSKMEKLVSDWEVSDEESMADHKYITYSIETETRDESVHIRNPRKTDWSKYLVELKAHLPLLPNELSDVVVVETYCQRLTSTIIDAFQASCPLREKKVHKEPPWWNETIEKLRRQTRLMSNRARRTMLPEDYNSYRQVRSEYKKEIRRSKRCTWRKFCEEISTMPPVCRIQKAMSKDRRVVTGPVMTDQNNLTKCDKEALEVLMKAHFPNCRLNELSEESDDHTEMPSTEVITEERVVEAIKMF